MNLIKFLDENHDLLKSVAPRCAEMVGQFTFLNCPLKLLQFIKIFISFQQSKSDDNPFDSIIDIIKYQRFLERISECLKHFFVHEAICEDDMTTHITTCDIIRVFCGILINLININEGLVELFYDCGLVFEIIRYRIDFTCCC